MTARTPADRSEAWTRADAKRRQAAAEGRRLSHSQALAEVAKESGFRNVHEMAASYERPLPLAAGFAWGGLAASHLAAEVAEACECWPTLAEAFLRFGYAERPGLGKAVATDGSRLVVDPGRVRPGRPNVSPEQIHAAVVRSLLGLRNPLCETPTLPSPSAPADDWIAAIRALVAAQMAFHGEADAIVNMLVHSLSYTDAEPAALDALGAESFKEAFRPADPDRVAIRSAR